MPIGKTKLRRRQYLVGISGVAKVSSRQTNSPISPTAARPERITPTEVHPTMGPMLRTSMAAVTAPARLQLPTQSMPSQALSAPARAAGSTSAAPVRPVARGQEERHHHGGDDQEDQLPPEQGAPTQVLDDR